MLSTLKKECVGSARIALIVCVVIAVIALAVSGFGITKIIAPTKIEDGCDLSEYEGKYVTIELEGVMTEYVRVSTVYESGKETVNWIGYLILHVDDWSTFEGETYYGILLPASKEKKMDQVIDDFWDWYVYGGDLNTLRVSGTVKPIEGKAKTYYESTISEIENEVWGEKCLNVQLYTIDNEYVGKTERSTVIGATVVALIALIIGIICMIYAQLCYDNAYKKFIQRHPNATEADVEADFQTAEKFASGLYLGNRFTFYISGMKIQVMDMSDKIWAYYYKRTGRNSVSQVRVYSYDRKMSAINESEAICTAYLKKLVEKQPHMVIGYTAELNQLYSKQFNEFLNIAYHPAKQAAQQQPAEDNFYGSTADDSAATGDSTSADGSTGYDDPFSDLR